MAARPAAAITARANPKWSRVTLIKENPPARDLEIFCRAQGDRLGLDKLRSLEEGQRRLDLLDLKTKLLPERVLDRLRAISEHAAVRQIAQHFAPAFLSPFLGRVAHATFFAPS